ncbi:MAG TPA: cell wall hydrolase [Methyloceanibacter sp.]|nr:cell wall hydrolase [Methyloceanibacter sp.]
MRIRRLLFVLSLTLLGGATPPDTGLISTARCLSSPAPQRTADTANTLPLLLPRPPLAQYDDRARDYLIRTLAFEAPNEPDVGKAAVIHVILNRMRSEKWGDDVKEVVTQRWQFEPWMTRRKEMEHLSPNDPRYRDAARITDAVLAGQLPDPTEGATHFLNPKVVRARRGGSLPAWARGEGQEIGRHTFYAPYEESGPFPRQAALEWGAGVRRSSC